MRKVSGLADGGFVVDGCGPVGGVRTGADQAVQGRMRPRIRLRAVSVPDRIHVPIVQVPTVTVVAADWVLPEAALPEGGFTAPGATQGLNIFVRVMPGACLRRQALDQVPAQAVIGSIERQRPDAVQMIGEQYPGVDRERMIGTHALDGVTQCLPKRRIAKDRGSPVTDDREETRCAGDARAKITWHATAIPCGGIRGQGPDDRSTLNQRCTSISVAWCAVLLRTMRLSATYLATEGAPKVYFTNWPSLVVYSVR